MIVKKQKGMVVEMKKFICVLLSLVMTFAVFTTGSAQVRTANIHSLSNVVLIKGNAGETNNGIVTVLAMKNGSLEYINEFPVESNGNYTVRFKFVPKGDIKDYKFSINAGGTNISETVDLAVVTADDRIVKLTLTTKDGQKYLRGDENEEVNLNVSVLNNEYLLPNSKLLYAVYGENGVDLKTINVPLKNNSSADYSFSVPKGSYAKAFLWNSFSDMKPVSDYASISCREYGYDRLNDKESDLSVVFLGGSITQGEGATDKSKSFASLVFEDYFKANYKNAQYFNAGIGGTNSMQGLYRLKKDVSSKNPDVVFVEFAVNDCAMVEAEQKRYIENIIKQLLGLPKQPVIVMLYTTFTGTDASGNIIWSEKNQFPNNIVWQKEIADNYGVASIDIHNFMAENYTAEQFENELSKDGTHPNDSGYRIYADYIISQIKTGNVLKKNNDKAAWITPERYRYAEPNLISCTDNLITYSEGFTHSDDPTKAYYIAGGEFEDGVMTTSKAGEKISFKFKGESVGIYVVRSKYGRNATISIDGSKPYEIKAYQQYDGRRPVIIYERAGLENSEHSVVITTTDSGYKNDSGEYSGEFSLGYIAVNREQ